MRYMDNYTDYCYESLADSTEGTKFLENLGFFCKQDIIDLKPVSGTDEKNIAIKRLNKIVVCKFCNSPDIIERSVQTRSLDESETLYTVCKSCKKTYSC